MYIRVTVQPKAKVDSVIKISEDTFTVKTRAKAEKNMANLAVIELISGYLNVPIGKIRVISGHHHPKKLLTLDLE